MENFVFQNPTRIIFGKGTENQVGSELKGYKKVLLHYGGGSIKKNGVYDQVKNALKDHNVIEFEGIEPNPTYETCMKAVEIVRKENIDFLLAVGGGSVLDGTKFISAASNYKGEDAYDIVSKCAPFDKVLPLAHLRNQPPFCIAYKRIHHW